jgi:hypothetical protein
MSTNKNEIMLVRSEHIVVQICQYDFDCAHGMSEECVKRKKD